MVARRYTRLGYKRNTVASPTNGRAFAESFRYGGDVTTRFGPPPTTQIYGENRGHDLGLTERRCQLVVMSGPEAGLVKDVEHTPFVVGKGEECDLLLTEPTVSRTHFSIDTEQGAFVIRDLSSTNGTWIDQFRIKEAWLRPGTVLRAGSCQLRFEPVFKPIDIAPASVDSFGRLVGRSVRMRQIFTLLERIAQTEATVVILGETGTGKSAVAQSIHENSPRRAGPFITVDCGAIADNLIESELFGHEKGAFTGADRTRQGALERAQGGTLFIDELIDLRLDLQPRLLRVLEEREVRRVGGNTAIKLDVRIIAASRQDLWREVQEKRFREDLYFRLAVFTLPLPALRERSEDIPLLATAFLRSQKGGERLLARFTSDVVDKLMRHPFPGNVRELRNVIERALHLDTDPTDMLGPSDLLPDFHKPKPASVDFFKSEQYPTPPRTPTAPVPTAAPLAIAIGDERFLSLRADTSLLFKDAKEQLLESFEAAYLKRLFETQGDNVSAIARAAGIDRKHLYTLMKKHSLGKATEDN